MLTSMNEITPSKPVPAGFSVILLRCLKLTLPVFFSYLFLSLGYGILVNAAGFAWYWAALAGIFVYTGAFQFVLTPLVCANASLLSIALTALVMNSRQIFYALTFLKPFSRYHLAKPYMIHSLTDETYALDCTLDQSDPDVLKVMLGSAILCQCYWVVGSVLGCLLGNVLPFDLTGIDFSMTALFTVILVDYFEKSDNRFPIWAGLGCGVLMLFVFGSTFMLPALCLVSALLVAKTQLSKVKTDAGVDASRQKDRE